jgi:hypothetical protein
MRCPLCFIFPVSIACRKFPFRKALHHSSLGLCFANQFGQFWSNQPFLALLQSGQIAFCFVLA